ncbi:MAG: site-specific integrase [Candidatus Binatia bacterium]
MEKRKYLEGFGSIFRKSFKRKRADGSEYVYESPTWEIAYYHHGQELRESSGSSEEKDAIRLLKKRIQDLGRGIVGTKEERVTFEQLTDDLKNDYTINARRSLASVELSISHLEKFFAGDKARHITTDRIRTYIAKRQEQGAANGSINRELSALKHAFSLAIQAGKLFHRPYVPMLEENNARQGFLDHAGFLALRAELPDYLKDPVSFLYLSGWRSGEMKSLEWRDVGADAIRLRAENSKNKKPRVLPIRDELAEIVERARQNRKPECPFVFHLDGRPIGDFRKAWRNAVKAAGLGKLLIHDMRRSAVRNFIRAGIREKVCMALSGHQTRSVFDRYHIVSEDDLGAASDRLFSYLEQQAESAKVVPIRKAS